MLDIQSAKYSNRKKYEYDDDIGVLFYKGMRVARTEMENFRESWKEESWNGEYEDLNDFFIDVVGTLPVELDPEDAKDCWEDIWEGLDWKGHLECYEYKNWQLVVLDL